MSCVLNLNLPTFQYIIQLLSHLYLLLLVRIPKFLVQTPFLTKKIGHKIAKLFTAIHCIHSLNVHLGRFTSQLFLHVPP